MDELSFKEVRTWGKSKISSSYICVLCESAELGRRRSLRFPCVTLVVETFSSDRVTFRIPSNINDGGPLQKQPAALACRVFPQINFITDIRLISICGSDWRRWESGVWVDYKCMEFVAAGRCTKKWLRFDQIIRNLTPGDADCFG